MGKRNKSFRSKKGYGGKREDRDQQGRTTPYASVPTENELYERYYNESALIPEHERAEFWNTLKRTLPTTFRFTGGKKHAKQVSKKMEETYVPMLREVIWDGELVDAPKPIPWYPDGLAWSTSVGKQTIRRNPPFKKFQNFLVAETTVGNISRQEAVSMIPPLLLDVKPGHIVLDMCAAPGSKTAQIVEAIHAGEEAAVVESRMLDAPEGLGEDGDVAGRSTGLVIANDADYKRSHMLVHQVKRLNSPNLIVVNHDATMFPSIKHTPEGAETTQYLKFDRILADVPCTGDGTPRKNYSVWSQWRPDAGLNLHGIQIKILARGLQMLKVGGRIVYSTCSMNPIENEAVVAAAIDAVGGLEKVSIVDVSDQLPELKRRPGVKGGWKVMDKKGDWYSSYDELIKTGKKPGRPDPSSYVAKSCFPSEDGKSDEDPTRIPLERCVRIYPHLQDTGGFFITVLEKKGEIRFVKDPRNLKKEVYEQRKKDEAGVVDPVKTEHDDVKAEDVIVEEDPAAQTTATESTATATEEAKPYTLADHNTIAPPKRKRELTSSPAPGVKKTKADETSKPADTTPASTDIDMPDATDASTTEVDQDQLQGFNSAPRKGGRGPPPEEPFKYIASSHPALSLITDFYTLSPRFPRTCFLVRNAEALPTRAMYFTSHLAREILMQNEGRGVKFVHSGVKAFVKQDVQSPDICPWRIQNEGLGLVAPWIGEERKIACETRETVRGLLMEMFPKVTGEDGFDGKIPEIAERVRELEMGCCVLVCKGGEWEGEEMILPLWKSRASCNLMLPKEERRSMLLRLFDETAPAIDSTNKNASSFPSSSFKPATAPGPSAGGASAVSSDATTAALAEIPSHVPANLSDAELLQGEANSTTGLGRIDVEQKKEGKTEEVELESVYDTKAEGRVDGGAELGGGASAGVGVGGMGNKVLEEEEEVRGVARKVLEGK